MSFLLGALGSIAKPLLGRAGSWLASKTGPALQKFGGWIGNTFGGGGDKGKQFGQSSMNYMVDKALNTTYDAAHKFANSNFVKRRMPIVAPYIKDGASEFRTRMRDGYSSILGNGDTGSGGGTNMGGGSGDTGMDGIEKTQNY